MDIIKKTNPAMIAISNHREIIQSILDYDFLIKRENPSIKCIITGSKNYERYYFGNKQIVIPCFQRTTQIPHDLIKQINYFVNLSSARRVVKEIYNLVGLFPNLIGGMIFAEGVTEQDALNIKQISVDKKLFIVGPASVGCILPGVVKLGPIGGVTAKQIIDAGLTTPGSFAVVSASGGMTNELINLASSYQTGISFATSVGGDRFPITEPREVFLDLERDSKTSCILYYGELGETYEYEIASLVSSHKVTKPILAYISGAISNIFENPPQFGHAKAIAETKEETAQAKRKALVEAGVICPDTYSEFVAKFAEIASSMKKVTISDATMVRYNQMNARKKSLFITSLPGPDEYSFSLEDSYAFIVGSMFLGRKLKSSELENLIDLILKTAVDNGPHVSGAVNTMITARAGRDLATSLASGVLTIGPRFGGATNEAARIWFEGVINNIDPKDTVEKFASLRQPILGIGHLKYRVDNPDPRVQSLLEVTKGFNKKLFTNYALSVEKITTGKKGNLILNFDGAIASVMLDVLSEKEKLSTGELERLIESEFFNALFIASRTVGLLARALDQKRLDEGLFRLPEEDVKEVDV
ncbi:hypothetical protein A2690_03150 [Candidatus Roizmanbacteria bacterium RIFCSPHIGHO2_01_FULL_39_12b]|uniref:ATP-citrate synthase/succinyl-CoA ligase C-terminal domain-containing protein n=1 Tax=Candidatus Roizmanbacteria bacterium RIFCSPHIGHO2_01_FULL_39_12b TaxID=1802030 RepID=A0A1F7GBC4_9BACT|nr:MAG: hypothetical protein A2690_03150 [Candidatus Roizmanbacteria bacterium RIFCSPHIGHO2_01_FULL_39_12b]